LANALKCQIIRVLNNNVVLVKDKANAGEAILVGRGIGYGRKKYDDVEYQQTQIEKSFQTLDIQMKSEYLKLLEQVDRKIIGLCGEIIAEAESVLGEMDSYIHLLLSNHVGFALERLKNQMKITNPFLYEIKVLYPLEFEIAKYAAKKISEHTNILVPESEAGFIAIYFHSAIKNKSIKETLKETRILREVIEIIESGIEHKINPEDHSYFRLINHLRAVLSRITNQKCVCNPIIETIKERFDHSFEIAKRIGTHIKEYKETDITEDELGYMAIHIERLKEIAKKEGSGFNQ